MINTKNIPRSPIEWLHDIKKLDEPERSIVAKIVWWDEFGEKPASRRWAHLDQYLWYDKNVDQIAPERLHDLLLQVGYNPYMARRRSGLQKNKPKKSLK